MKSEFNGDDYINGIGTELWLTDNLSNLGLAVSSSLGKGKVKDTEGWQQEFISWDFGIKYGYFSDVFAYVEVGVDLSELILQDRDEDEYDERHYDGELVIEIADAMLFGESRKRYDQDNDVDAYLGAGLGVKLEHFAIEAFSRYRQIDGEYWKADNQVFTGVKLTVFF
ncbi:hypothetical protein [Thalassotalea insulae]|uniref:hypothetical protein n=1 Tax=Thalassotalea insulae TaxID=2056778 RepID=UPI0024E0A1E4|nr:hypothetical protein [Thalassotalea insulae]